MSRRATHVYRMTFNFKCPLCKTEFTTPKFKKPSLFDPSIVNVKCTGCESRFALKITKPRGNPDKMAITVTVVGTFPSEKYKSSHYQVGW
jgi:hypothetical protein